MQVMEEDASFHRAGDDVHTVTLSKQLTQWTVPVFFQLGFHVSKTTAALSSFSSLGTKPYLIDNGQQLSSSLL